MKLFGREPPYAFAVHRELRRACGRHDTHTSGFELTQDFSCNRFDLGYDKMRIFFLDDRAQGVGVEHRNRVRAVGDLLCRRAFVAVDGNDFAAEAHEFDNNLAAEFP